MFPANMAHDYLLLVRSEIDEQTQGMPQQQKTSYLLQRLRATMDIALESILLRYGIDTVDKKRAFLVEGIEHLYQEVIDVILSQRGLSNLQQFYASLKGPEALACILALHIAEMALEQPENQSIASPFIATKLNGDASAFVREDLLARGEPPLGS